MGTRSTGLMGLLSCATYPGRSCERGVSCRGKHYRVARGELKQKGGPNSKAHVHFGLRQSFGQGPDQLQEQQGAEKVRRPGWRCFGGGVGRSDEGAVTDGCCAPTLDQHRRSPPAW